MQCDSGQGGEGLHGEGGQPLPLQKPGEDHSTLLGVSKCGNKSISLNSYINSRIEMKKLTFHTPDISEKNKMS